MSKKKHIYPLWIALSLGLVLRFIHLYMFSKSALFAPIGLDELYHHFWALDIASGNLIADGVFFRAPLYPYLLGTVYWLGDGSLLLARLPGLISGMVSIYLAWFASLEFTNRKSIAGLAAIVFAVNPVFIYFESRLLLDFLLIPFILIVILSLQRADKKGGYLFLAGLSSGFFIITRPTFLALIPFLCAYIYLSHRKFVKLLPFLLATALPVLPVFISNLSHGSTTLVASQGGINFFIGNNEQADGVSASFPGLGNAWHNDDAVRLVKEQYPEITEKEISGHFYREGLEFLFSPKGMKLLLKKTGLFFHGAFIGNNGDIDFYRRFSPVLRIPNPSGLIFAFGIMGLIFVRKKGMPLIALLIIIYSGIVILFFVNTRFKLPVYPPLILSAAFFIDYTIDQTKGKRVIILTLAIFLSILFSIDFFGLSNFNSGAFHFSMGIAEMRQGRHEQAEDYFHQSLEENPTKSSANLNLGIIALKKGRLDEAIRFFHNEVDIEGDKAKALSNIGMVNRLLGNSQEAIRYGKIAVSESGDRRDAYYNLSRTYFELGQEDSAQRIASEGLRSYPDNLRLLYAKATAMLKEGSDSSYYYFAQLIENGNRDLVQNYDFGSRIQADMGLSGNNRELIAKAHFNMARPGLPIDSIENHLEEAIRLDPSFQEAYIQLGNIKNMKRDTQMALSLYRLALENGPMTPLLAFNLGNSEAAMGNYTRAKELFQIAAEDSNITAEAQKRLKALERIIP